MTQKKLKIHQEDWDQAKDFLRAKSFIVIYQGGRGVRETIRDIPSYEEALVKKKELEDAIATRGRTACVYALTPNFYGILVTPQVLHCVEELRKKENI